MCAQRVAVFGEALIDLIETPAGVFEPHVGGSPFNVCRGFARLGLECDYLSPISRDRMGERIAATALAESINIEQVPRSERPSSLALVAIDSDGQPSYRLYREGVADLDIDAATLAAAVHPDCCLFHTGSLALVPEMETALSEVFAGLRGRGLPISIDANLRSGVARDNRAYLASVRRLIACADILKVSDEDLQLLGVAQPLDFCRELVREGGVKLVAFTEGEQGAALITRAGEVRMPASVPKPIGDTFGDTVGAGDTFFAALLSYLIRKGLMPEDIKTLADTDLQIALAFAQQAASLSVSRKGCNPPSLAEVESALNITAELSGGSRGG